jgi:hypothetical protein
MPDSPSTTDSSWFAEPLNAAVPIVFLPLRLETRFGTSDTGAPELWVRAFPDDVHVDSFEPELTAAERAARDAYLSDPDATATDADRRLAAWARVARRFGPARAAWIVSADAATAGDKTSDWTRAASTSLLPDRLIFTAYDAEGGIVRQPGAEIADGLPLGPSPAGGDPATDEGLRWMHDFKRAVELGLAARLPVTPLQQSNGFTRVVVFGVKSRLAPEKAAQRFGQVLDAHHYTDGVEVLPHGTPTNNADGVKAGYRTDDATFADSFSVERGTPRIPSGDGQADGDHLARALGVAPARFAFVRGSDGRHDDPPAAMNTVLWPATLGYYLQNMVVGVVPDADNVLADAREHFRTWVRARGPWPALRIGRQPYGLVPVVASRAYQAVEGTSLARLFGLLQQLRGFWTSSVGQVPRVVPGCDPDSTLAAILGMSPSSTNYAGRTVLGPQFNEYYWRFLGRTVDSAWFTKLGQLSTSLLGSSGSTMAATRLGEATYLAKHFSLTPNLVATPLADAPLTDNYLQTFDGMTMAQLRDAPPPPSPAPLLWLLVRHAALRQYVDSAQALLGTAVPAANRLEPELVNISPVVATSRVWDQLALPLPSGEAAGAFLDQHKQDGPLPFVEFWKALGALAGMSTTDLDRALREALDLCSHRLDAWYTSLASLRLDTVRRQSGNQQTIYLGAYGWVENVRPETATPSWGYVHAPSLAHAATAAVLRSGYLSHQSGGSAAAAIDLSSTRVRRAQQLLDGVRAGQPIGAQLGYQFERALHERTQDVYIARFRTFGRVEGVAGDPVVDGLALLDQRSSIPWGTGNFPPVGSTAQVVLDGILSELADTVDAVSDLMLAESVHQLVGGNAVRAGATVDALGRGDSPPPALDVTRTPRRGGLITYRLLALLDDAAASDWPVTPRGRAEPRVAAFVAALLGAPARVRARAQVVDATGAVRATVEITLADVGLGPLDVIALNDRAPGTQGQSPLEQRLARAAWARRPAFTPADAHVVLVLDRDPAWPADVLAIDELLTAALAARTLLARARGATALDFSVPDKTVELSIDTAELQSRADAAVAALTAARARFDPPGPVDAALDGAGDFGVEGAVPSLDASTWPAQAELVKSQLDARVSQVAALDAAFTRAGAAVAALRDHDLARMRLVFGQDFLPVPCLSQQFAAGIGPLFARSDALLGGKPVEAVTWFARVARVRAGVARLDEAILQAESLSAGARLDLSVAQLPVVDGDVWAALPLPTGAKPVDRLSIVALGAPATARAALFIDEWLETVPNTSETTGLTFHVHDATSRAPQAILLGVQPDATPQWTLASVEATIIEAIELAHLRAVDPDSLGVVGHFLPALFFATNLGSPTPDTVATDLTLAAPPPRLHPPPIVIPPVILKATGGE